METIRVLIVDDHPVVRQGVRSLLVNHPDIQVVGEADSAASLFASDIRPQVQELERWTLQVRIPGKAQQRLTHTLRFTGIERIPDPLAAFLVDDASEVNPRWLDGVRTVAVTAGASAPEHLVQELISALRIHGFQSVEDYELKEEDVRFSLPSELAQIGARLSTIDAP